MDRDFLDKVKEHGAFQTIRRNINASEDPEAFRQAIDEMFRVDLPVLDVDDIRGGLVDIVRPYLELFGPARQGRCHPLDLGDGIQRYSTDDNSPDWVESAIEAIKVVDRIVAESRGKADLQIAARAFDLGLLVQKIDIQINTDDVTQYGAKRLLHIDNIRPGGLDVAAAEKEIDEVLSQPRETRSRTQLRRVIAEKENITYDGYMKSLTRARKPPKK